MLVNMKDMLAKAAREGYGVGNFDVFNTELPWRILPPP